MDIPLPPKGMPQGYYIEPKGKTWLLPHCVLPGIWTPHADPQPNKVMYDWATVAAKLLAGDVKYALRTMYLEFRNLDDPDEVIAAPTYEREDGIAYYEGLAESEDTDYLRVPIFATIVTSNDETKYPQGNVSTSYAQSSGVVGVHGKTFSSGVNSKIFGGALVASPDPEDASLDLVVSRFYFTGVRQLVKLANSQIGIGWPLAQS